MWDSVKVAPLLTRCRLGARGARVAYLAFAATCLAGAAGCNEERKQECDKFLGAMAPLKSGTPSSTVVDRVSAEVSAIAFQDQPLGVYAKNYQQRLSVLSSTLKLKENAATPDAVPDGTQDVIQKTLAGARTDDADITRYCAP
jgi:hypothetical protein